MCIEDERLWGRAIHQVVGDGATYFCIAVCDERGLDRREIRVERARRGV
jgi:hypothetical protein